MFGEPLAYGLVIELEGSMCDEEAQGDVADGKDYELTGGGIGMCCMPRIEKTEDKSVVCDVERIADVAQPFADLCRAPCDMALCAHPNDDREEHEDADSLVDAVRECRARLCRTSEARHDKDKGEEERCEPETT